MLHAQEKDGAEEAKTISEKPGRQSNKNSASLNVKAKRKDRKHALLKRLMLFGLKPSLRMAALKMLMCKKKRMALCDLNDDDVEGGFIADKSGKMRFNSPILDDDDGGKVGIKCPICFANIKDSLLLEQHLALSHAKDVTYKCGICAFVCQYHGDYLNHMKTHFPGPPFKCDYCKCFLK